MLKKLIGVTLGLAHPAALLCAISAHAECGSLSGTVTNLPGAPDTGYQVNGLNSAGQITGYFYNGETFGEAFVYDSAGLHDLGNLGGFFSQGRAINNSGTVVGDSMDPSGESHAVLYSNGTVLDLGTLGGSSASAGLLNEAGQAVGSSFLAGDGAMEAFIYSNGSMTALGRFGGSFSAAFGLNNHGVVVGESSTATGDIHAFVYTNGPIQDLGTLGGPYAAAFAINDSGLIVGESSTPSGDTHAFLYNAGAMTDLGGFGGSYSSAFLLNQSNQVAGFGLDAIGVYHGFFFANGTLTDLGTLGSDTYAAAMNNFGRVVGQSRLPDGSFHAFLWQNGTLTDLNSIIPTNSGWVLEDAMFINDAGRVVGLGQLDGVEQCFILDLSSGNHAPIASSGSDQTVECGTQVTLDGSHSSDPDGDSLAYEWSSAGSVLGTNAVLSGFFALGTNVVTLKVSDPCGESASATVTVVVQDTTAPTIVSAPGAQTVSVGNDCQGTVPNVLSGIVASDNCTAGGQLLLSQTPAAGTSVPKGQSTIHVIVADASGNQSSVDVPLNVVDTTAPTIVSSPGSQTVSTGNDGQGIVPNVVGGIVASDNCTPADQLLVTQDPAAGTSVPQGQTTIHVVVTDGSGNLASLDIPLAVVDTTPPVIQSLSVSPNVLSPPNHSMIPVTVSIVTSDNSDASPLSRIISISCNEAVQQGEIQITGPLTASLAATRNGGGGGRIYTLTVQSCDASGNKSQATVTVTVPQGGR